MKKHQGEILQISQALLNKITPNFRAVWFEIEGDEVNIYIAMYDINEADKDAIKEFKEDYDALLETPEEKYSITEKIYGNDSIPIGYSENIFIVYRKREL